MNATHRLLPFVALAALIAAPTFAHAAGLSAETFTWRGFYEYWSTYFRGTSAAMQVVTGTAILALAIIMLGYKWRK